MTSMLLSRSIVGPGPESHAEHCCRCKEKLLCDAKLQVYPDHPESVAPVSCDRCVFARLSAMRESCDRVVAIREIKKEKASVGPTSEFGNHGVFTLTPNLHEVSTKHTRSVSGDPSDRDLAAKNLEVAHCAACNSMVPILICFSVTSVTGSA